MPKIFFALSGEWKVLNARFIFDWLCYFAKFSAGFVSDLMMLSV